jgi:26S proteasome regulatory subunit N3
MVACASLRANVIKAGLRKINLAYSRISVDEICRKLGLDNVEDGESMVAKSIHDGVIDATLDRATRQLQSKDVSDIYSTTEPQQAFHKRIHFTLDIQQQAVKSLRYPPQAGRQKNDWESDDEEDEDTIAGNAPDKREEDKKA